MRKHCFTIIGFGEVGSLVAALLNSHYENVNINVLNTQSEKSGRILDLEHAAACRNNTIEHNSLEGCENSEVIVYAAGFSNIHGESRNSVARKNRTLITKIFEGLSLKKDCTIIVITNPVEPISFWIHEQVKSNCQVIGTGTALDTFRLKHFLAERFSISKEKVRTIVAGEHGQGMVPVFSFTTIDGKPINDITLPSEREEILAQLKNAAFEIRETEKATKYGIAQTCLEIVEAVVSKKEMYLAVSILTLPQIQSFLGLPCSIFFSYPGNFKGGAFLPDLTLQFTQDEKDQLKLAANNITKVISEAS